MFFRLSQLQSSVGSILLKKKQTHKQKNKQKKNMELLSVRKVWIEIAESCLRSQNKKKLALFEKNVFEKIFSYVLLVVENWHVASLTLKRLGGWVGGGSKWPPPPRADKNDPPPLWIF